MEKIKNFINNHISFKFDIATIASFIIEDEENNTKCRILVSKVKPYVYYSSLLIVFYLEVYVLVLVLL